ncbi:hypothetical protein BJX66DRAFT_312488 [Aspergillus keveii]|uniref:Uncharacterized protein n=1 Tax=Aspergillus keveii TaxID=714993 RepID=A0ABR4FTM2_9EURO
MRLDSSSLLNYLLQRFGKNTIERLDMGPLFFRAVIQGKEKMAAALKACPWVHLSEDELNFQCSWSNVLTREYICADLLEFYYRCCQVGASLSENTYTAFKGRSPNWDIPIEAFKSSRITRCTQIWKALCRYFETFQESGLYLPYEPRNSATSLPRQLNPLARLHVYFILTGPYSSALWSHYFTELTRRCVVRSLTSHISQSSHYSPPSITRHLRARFYLFDTCAEILEHLAMRLNSEPTDPSSKNDANFSVLLRLVCCLLDLGIGFLLWNMGLPKHGTQDRGEALK